MSTGGRSWAAVSFSPLPNICLCGQSAALVPHIFSGRGFLEILENFPDNEVKLYKSPGKFGILWKKNRGQGSVPAGTEQNMSTVFRWTVDSVKDYFYCFIKNFIKVFIRRTSDWSWKVFKSDIYCNVNTNKWTSGHNDFVHKWIRTIFV